jgi:hypothetical protein
VGVATTFGGMRGNNDSEEKNKRISATFPHNFLWEEKKFP